MSTSSPTPAARRVEVPLGSRVLIRSDLQLCSPATEDSAWSASLVVQDLERWTGSGVVILAGGLCLDPGVKPSAVLAAHSKLDEALTRFAEGVGRSVHVLDESVGDELVLACATATGSHEVLVTTTPRPGRLAPEDTSAWLSGIELIEDPDEQRRFATSRTLYRRLGSLLWVPPLLAVLTAIVANLAVVNRTLHRIGRHGRIITEVADATTTQRLLAVVIAVVLVELLGGLVVVLVARSAFDHRGRGSPRGVVRDEAPTAIGAVDQSTMDLARGQLALGRIGTIAGGALSPSLTHLDPGFVAVPGATTRVVRAHRGHLGLPPVYLEHRQNAAVLLETGAELYVQLLAGDQLLAAEHRLERLVAGAPLEAIPGSDPAGRLVASWPTGDAWPPPVDLAKARGQARRIRRIAGLSIFLTGLFDLLLAVAPPLRGRLHRVLSILPLGVSQTAAAAVAVTGLSLVMLSRGVFRGQRRSWLAAVILLAISTVLHLAHAINVGAVVLSLGVLILLLVERRHFTATTDRTSLAAAAPALVSIVVVAVMASFAGIMLSNLRTGMLPAWPSVLLGVTERLVGLSTVALPDKVDDFVYPTMLTVGIGVLLTSLYLVTRPVVDRRLSSNAKPTERRLAEHRARDIVRRHGRGTLDYFALRDDKQFFFYGDSVVTYAVFGGIALVSPDPIGPMADRTQIWAAFRNYCDAHAWGVGVIGAGEDWLPIYSDSGMRYLYLGDEAVVDVQHFSLQGGKMKGLRQACTRLERNGYTVEYLDPATIEPARIPPLIELMGLNRRGEGERGFSMMLGRLFDPKDEGLLLTVVNDADGCPAAMCQFVPSPAINGYSLDLMRRDPGERPNGLLDYALCSTIEHLREQGAMGLSLNFSAFRSTLDGERGEKVTQRIERWGLKKLSAILPIETLWKFNEKYQPSWLARHLVYASPETFVPVVSAALRAESITEIPVVGRFLAQDPSNRPGTVVPPEILEAAEAAHHEAS